MGLVRLERGAQVPGIYQCSMPKPAMPVQQIANV